jgi:virginiamycin B lyase
MGFLSPRSSTSRARWRRHLAFDLVLVGGLLLAGLSLPASQASASPRSVIETESVSNLQNIPITEYPIPLHGAGPLSIAQAQDGSFWVAEFSAGDIAQFFPTNGTIRQFAVPEPNAAPTYVTLDNFGRVWFSDQAGPGSVWMLDPSTGNFSQYQTITLFSSPVGVAVDPKNNVWFAEDSGNTLGELVYPGYSMREFHLPQGHSGPAELALETDQASPIIWITESLGNRIAMFNTATDTFQEFTPSVPFASPVGIVLDSAGHVWVAEHGDSSIVEFDPKLGNFTSFPTSPPPVNSGYSSSAPATLAIDRQGRLWFVEHFSNKIGRLDPETRSMDEFQIPSYGVYSVLSAIDSTGNFWFTEFTANKIGVISANASVPILVRGATLTPPSLEAGGSEKVGFTIANNLTASVTAQLGVTSTFSETGASSNQASLNATSTSLSPGRTVSLVASVRPDGSLPSGSYSVGVVVQVGNVSTVGTVTLQITANATNTFLFQTLPDLLTVLLFYLAAANVYVWRVQRERKARFSPSWALGSIFMVTLVLILGLQATPTVVSKCPGLPGINSSSNSPYLAGIIFDVIELPLTVVLTYFLIRGIMLNRRERRAKLERQAVPEEKEP